MQVVYTTMVQFVMSTPLILLLEKRCTACVQFKELDAFSTDNAQQDLMKTMCRACRNNPQQRSFSTSRFTSAERKYCTGCLQEKALTDFNLGMHKGGYQSQCNECRSKQNAQWREDTYEQRLAYDRQRGKAPERKAAWNQRFQERYATDPAFVEQRKIRRQLRHQAHPLEAREYVRKRQARKKLVTTGRVSYKRIIERDGYVCYICTKMIDPTLPWPHSASLEFEHVIPLDRGGPHSEDNIRPTHLCCNRRKRKRLLEEMTPFQRRGP